MTHTPAPRLVAVALLGLAFAAPLCALAQPSTSDASLVADFAAPPESARPWVYWFWLNGNITREGITADLEAMQRQGVGGVLIMEVDQGAPVGPADFAGDQWRELFAFMLAEADRLGIEVNMNNDAGWNGSGGPWVTPENGMQRVVWTETKVSGPSVFEGALPQPETRHGYYRDIATFAFPTPGDWRIPDLAGKTGVVRGDVGPQAEFPQLDAAQIVPRDRLVDLTDKVTTGGRLQWQIPAGNWTILRLGHTCTGALNQPSPVSGQGLECDKLSKTALDQHWAGMMGKVIADSPALAGSALVATHIDSWENGSQNWTPDMPREFARLRGYDLHPFLPVFAGYAVDSAEVSERFLWDLRQTIGDLLLDNYGTHMRDLARQHGMRLTIEAYGDTTMDNMAFAGRCDEPMGEFWSWPSFGAAGTLTEMSSASHVYGKRITGAEAFTAGDGEKWLYHPGSIKAMGDWAFCLGINRFVFHRYALQPWPDRRPGMTMGPWGLHYERTQTWWEESGTWHKYLARCQQVLQSGQPVVDFLYLAPEGTPRSYNPPAILSRAGYKADACPTDALLNRISVSNRRLVTPDGMSYRALVLPGSPTMTPQLLAELSELVRQGATVIGTAPTKAPGLTGFPQCDQVVRDGAAQLWGMGKIITDKAPEAVLASRGIPPDFTSDRILDFIHRRVGDTDAYFVASAFGHAVNATCSFRVAGKRPELWDPCTGRRSLVAAYATSGGVTRMPLRLEGSGSVFVVFRPGQPVRDPVVAIHHADKAVWPATPRHEKITITRATWGPGSPGARTWDMTARVQQYVDAGTLSFLVRDLASAGDPAPNVLKTLRVEYLAGGDSLTATANDGQVITLDGTRGPVVIKSAYWGPEGDKLYREKDVTDQVQRKVDSGQTSFIVADLASEGDPAFQVVKTLRVEYVVEGQTRTTSAQDPEMVHFEISADDAPPVSLERLLDGSLRVQASVPGRVELDLASGRTLKLRLPERRATTVDGPWDVSFTPGWGAPPSITLDRLASWSDHPEDGVRYFSGTGTYRRTVTIPENLLTSGRALTLDLGRVEVMARVTLNGQDLGLLWKAPYQVDITRAARAGENTLEIAVTNLWPNRMIGDEQLPEDSKRWGNGTLQEWPQWLSGNQPSPTGRFTFTSWRLWGKRDALLPSGLLGPVTIASEPVAVIAGPRR